MDMRIGDGATSPRTIRPSARPERPRPAEEQPAASGGRKEDVSPFPQRDRLETGRAGFGDGSVSGPTAAVHTLRNGLRSIRQVLPTPEEIREKVREGIDKQNRRRAEGIEERHAQGREQEAQRIERRIPEPSARARNFIRTLDQTAATVDARLRGEEPPSEGGEAQIQINGERFAFKRPSVTPQFDTSV